ncbi:TPA: oligosaccharide flippase family protein [Streptococcus suis]
MEKNNIFKNTSMTVLSNLLSMIVSAMVILIVPKVISVTEYSYFQLYIFYITYIGFFHFGWNDGIYLRYGGKYYAEIDKKKLFSQFYLSVLFQFIIVIIINLILNFLELAYPTDFIIRFTTIAMLINNSRGFLSLLLQATNKLLENSIITVSDKIYYFLAIIIYLMLGNKSFYGLIFADILGKLLSLGYACYVCKEVVFRNFREISFDFNESFQNIRVGINLMFATIASSLITGFVKYAIENQWRVEVFGQVSLTLSISSLIMTFVNALGIAIFPVLRRTTSHQLRSFFEALNWTLMPFLLGCLLIYYPINIFVSIWLPNYSVTLEYMSILFPIIVLEGKMSLMLNTYYKVLRMEQVLLKINISAMVISLILTYISAYIFKNLMLTIIVIPIVLFIRSTIAELFLKSFYKLKFTNIYFEGFISFIFIALNYYLDNMVLSALIYFFTYVMYITFNWKRIKGAVNNLNVILKIDRN